MIGIEAIPSVFSHFYLILEVAILAKCHPESLVLVLVLIKCNILDPVIILIKSSTFRHTTYGHASVGVTITQRVICLEGVILKLAILCIRIDSLEYFVCADF